MKKKFFLKIDRIKVLASTNCLVYQALKITLVMRVTFHLTKKIILPITARSQVFFLRKQKKMNESQKIKVLNMSG